MKPFIDLGYRNVLGIEPAKNLADIANNNGINTYNGYIEDKAKQPIKNGADLILASNVFAHSDDLKLMAENMKKLLRPDGKIVIEVQYLLNTIKDLTFDNIYHEHTNYWSLSTISAFLKSLDLLVYKAEKINTHGGSIRVYVSKNKNEKIDNSVFNII